MQIINGAQAMNSAFVDMQVHVHDYELMSDLNVNRVNERETMLEEYAEIEDNIRSLWCELFEEQARFLVPKTSVAVTTRLLTGSDIL
jgi:hypothetical protein